MNEPAAAPAPQPRFPRRKLAVALVVAAVADGLSIFLTLAPPVQWAVDLTTAVLLFIVLGWQWVLLPGLILEAIPVVGVFPLWILVVGAVAAYGSARPRSPKGPS